MASSIVLDIVREDYELLFSHLKAPEPREGLLDVILERVEKERATQILKRRLRLSISASAVSLAAFIPVFNVFGGWVRSSGFSEFASFLFLDSEIIMAYWMDFGFAVLESMPAASIALLVASVFIFAQSIRFINRDLKILYEFR